MQIVCRCYVAHSFPIGILIASYHVAEPRNRYRSCTFRCSVVVTGYRRGPSVVTSGTSPVLSLGGSSNVRHRNNTMRVVSIPLRLIMQGAKLTVHDLLLRDSHLIIHQAMLLHTITQPHKFPREVFQ